MLDMNTRVEPSTVPSLVFIHSLNCIYEHALSFLDDNDIINFTIHFRFISTVTLQS